MRSQPLGPAGNGQQAPDTAGHSDTPDTTSFRLHVRVRMATNSPDTVNSPETTNTGHTVL
eukprot:11566731-Alexandrium_andersonii.AAC.1